MILEQKVLDRFWAKVNKTETCWLWTGPTDRDGYGMFTIPNGRPKPVGAHRISWMLVNGDIPAGQFVCRTCDAHGCLRPDHHFLGSSPSQRRNPAGGPVDYGYGTWEVCCSRCGQTRSIRSHKYKSTGKVRGGDNMCLRCMGEANIRRVPVKCPACGMVRNLTTTEAGLRLSGFCRKCVRKNSLARRGKNGTRLTTTTSHGYVIVVGMSGHPLAKKSNVTEHWLTLYEQHPMGPESVLWFKQQRFSVHHKNGVRDDNRLENLELRAPGRHPNGWTIEDMEEVIRRYHGSKEEASR